MVALRKGGIYPRQTLTTRKEGDMTLGKREGSYKGEKTISGFVYFILRETRK